MFAPPLDVSPLIPAGTEPVTYPFTFSKDQIVYWQVEEQIQGFGKDDPNNIVGMIWSFEAIKSIPTITGQPANALVDPGQTATFTLDVASISEPEFAWYRSADNANDTPFDDELIGMAQTLAIDNVQVSDEGYYYCVVTNDSGVDVTSNVAKLGIKRTVAHWTLDAADFVGGLYLDVSGHGRHAEPNLPPDAAQFVDGVDPAKTGQALDLAPQPLSAADAGDWAAAAFTNQVTISAWVKWAGTNGSWQGIVSNRVTPGEGNFYFEIQPGGSVQFNTPAISELVAPSLPVGQWTHLAATASTAGIVIYVNGQRVAGREPAASASIGENSVPMYIGALQRNNGILASPFNGVLDDVRIYNYAKDRYGVADLYYDVTEIPLCLNPDSLDMRFDVAGGGPNGDQPDCKVTLIDFAVFAQTWLNCGYYPQFECD